ncbi:MAG: hypothetical protein K2L97_03870 [Muribaculaceae bacterium]|nr:hypothetical protein [Muribaculaceae bacterium]
MKIKHLIAAGILMAAGLPAMAAIPGKFIITPGENAVVEQITTIEIYGKTVSEIYSYPHPDIRINDQAVEVTSRTTGDEDDLLIYTLAQPITETGNYTIVIGEESFYYDWYETDNEEISWSVTVEAVQTPDPEEPQPFVNPSSITIDPAQGKVKALSSFVITFGDLWMADYNSYKSVTLKDYYTDAVVTTATIGDGPNLNDGLITLSETVSTPGTYVLDVPEGAFYDYMDDDDCPATKWLYIVEGGDIIETPDNIISTPANGDIVEKFETITVTFVDYDVVYLRQNPEVKVIDNSGETVATATLTHATASNAVTATLDTPITDKGKYTFVIPNNVIILGEDGNNAQYNATVNVKFAVQPFEMPDIFDNPGVSIYPPQGRYGSLVDFTLTFTSIQLPDINYTKTITLVNNNTNEVVATGKAQTGSVINQLVIDLSTPVLEAGEYTLICPEGAFYNAGSYDEEDMPEYKFLYVLDGSGDIVEPTPDNVYADPESGETVGALEEITLTYADYDVIYRHDDSGIKVVADDGETVTTGKFSYGNTAANQMLIKFNEAVTENGHYTVVIPKRALILGDMKFAVFSAPLHLEYTVQTSGVESIAVDGELTLDGVYNLQGIRVADTPEALPAGLYIYGGKKILVK